MSNDDGISVEVIVKFTAENLIDRSTLDEVFHGDLAEWVKELIQEDGLFGVVADVYEIVVITEVNECTT